MPGQVETNKVIEFAGVTSDFLESKAVERVLESKWLANGKEVERFEREFADYVGSKFAIAVNSGSSANLLALASLNLPRDSKVLTSACGFPATLAPILHLGLEPVLIDYDLETHNADIQQAYEKLDEVDAVILAHTMGIPLAISKFSVECDNKGIPFIEDSCESVGSKLNDKFLGTFGDLGTFSFYPAHQITSGGEGGMIVTDEPKLANRIKSLRGWGKRVENGDTLGYATTDFMTRVGDVPYYKGYTYDTVGFNMKMSEMNAAYARVQLSRLNAIKKKRQENYRYLRELSKELHGFIEVKEPIGSDSNYFGYTFTFKHDVYKRDLLVRYLEQHGVRTRPFFAGNITKHTPFKHLKGNFPVADHLMKNSFFVGVWPGLDRKDMERIIEEIKRWQSFQ